MTRVLVGIAITPRYVAGIAVRRGVVAWHDRVEAGEDGLSAALARIRARVPRRALDTLRIHAVLSPSLCQLRQIHGIPANLTPGTARSIVDENWERFFLRAATRPVIALPVRLEDGALTTAALDQEVVRAIRDTPSLNLHALGAAAAVMPFALQSYPANGAFEWRFDDETMRIRMTGKGAASAHPFFAEADDHSAASVRLVDALRKLPLEFAPAYAAAVADWRFVPALGADELTKADPAPGRLTRMVCAAALVLAAGAWIFAPGILASRIAENALKRERDQHVLLSRVSTVAAHAKESAALDRRVAEFRNTRRSMVGLLSEMTSALPDSTAVASMRIDSTSGTLTLLSPRTMKATRGLAGLKALDGVRVAGQVSREIVGGKELERVTLKFRLRRQDPRA